MSETTAGCWAAALEARSPGEEAAMSDDDAQRLVRMFDAHHSRIWRLALRMTVDREEAEDLMQETFLRAVAHRRRLPKTDPELSAWLTRTLVNLCRDRVRRLAVRSRHRNELRRSEAGEKENPEGVTATRQRIDAALRGLAPRRRAILVMRDLEGITEAEVARQLGIRRATVRWHLAAARRHLREHLGSEEGR